MLEEATGQRRSARISALEEKARVRALEKKTKSATSNNVNTASTSQTASRKKNRKRKSLRDVEGEISKQEDASVETGHLPSLEQMPSKETLEFILDVLQRRDTLEIFAQPVDCNEVKKYYDTIKEPMDFGTMRAKLQEGMYTDFDQFEHDVNLISTNAMTFNASDTVFYTEALAINEMAKRIFHSLKTDPESFQLEFSGTRKRLGKKSQDEAGGLNNNVAKPGSVKDLKEPPYRRKKHLTSSRLNIHRKCKKIASESRDGRLLNPNKRRNTYIQSSFCSGNESLFSTIYSAPKSIALVSNADISYAESLARFVRDLGPTAQAVARKKLGKHPIETSTSFSNNSDFLFPEPSAFHGPTYPNCVHIVQMPHSSIFNSPGSYKGKAVCDDGEINFGNSFQAEMLAAIEEERAHTSNGRCGNGIFLGEKAVNTSRKKEIGASSFKGKTTRNGENTDLLMATLMQITANKSPSSSILSGSYFPFTETEKLPCVYPSMYISGSRSSFPPSNHSGPMMSFPSQTANGSIMSQAKSSLSGIDSYHLKGKALMIASAPELRPKYVAPTPFFHGFSSHNPNGEGPSSGFIYGAKSNQVFEPVEWSHPVPWNLHAMCDVPDLQMQANKQIPSSQYFFMPLQSSKVASSAQDRPLLFDAIKAQKQIPSSQSAFILQESPQVESLTQEKPLLFDAIKANEQMFLSSQNPYMLQQSSLAAYPSQEKLYPFDATSFFEGANPQGRQAGPLSGTHFLENTPVSSLVDKLLDLDLQL